MVQSPSDYLEETSIIGQSLARSTKSLLESSYKCVTNFFLRSMPARSSSDLYLPHLLRSILRRASADEISRLVARAFHEDVLGPFQDSMASLDPEVLAEDAEDSSSVLDFPVQSALLLLSVLKEEVRDPSQ